MPLPLPLQIRIDKKAKKYYHLEGKVNNYLFLFKVKILKSSLCFSSDAIDNVQKPPPPNEFGTVQMYTAVPLTKSIREAMKVP